METVTLQLTQQEVQFIMAVLGDLPTKTGAFPLVMKIQEQLQAEEKQNADA